MTLNLRSGRRLAALAIFAIVALSAFGFAASNTVDPSQAGDGTGAITGFGVNNIHYSLDGTDPSQIDGVTFDTDSAANEVAAALDAATPVACTATNAAGTSWNCPVTGSALAAATLRVIAVD